MRDGWNFLPGPEDLKVPATVDSSKVTHSRYSIQRRLTQQYDGYPSYSRPGIPNSKNNGIVHFQLNSFLAMYRAHCCSLLDAVVTADFEAVRRYFLAYIWLDSQLQLLHYIARATVWTFLWPGSRADGSLLEQPPEGVYSVSFSGLGSGSHRCLGWLPIWGNNNNVHAIVTLHDSQYSTAINEWKQPYRASLCTLVHGQGRLI